MVISADDDAGAVAYNRRAKYLGGAQDGAIDGSLVAADVVYHLVLRIEHQDAHLLVIEVRHLHHHEVGGILGRGDLVLLFGLQRTEPSAYFQRRLQLRCFGRAQPILRAQLTKFCTHQPAQASIFGKEFTRQFEDIIACIAGAQDNGQQFRVRERLRAIMLEPFAWAFVAGEIMNSRVVYQFYRRGCIDGFFEGRHGAGTFLT